jgi:hypothetical protein
MKIKIIFTIVTSVKIYIILTISSFVNIFLKMKICGAEKNLLVTKQLNYYN